MQRCRSFQHVVAMALVNVTIFTLVLPSPAMAKSRPGTLGWDNVLRLKQGDLIRVGLFSHQEHKGKVDKVEPNGITLTTKDGTLLLNKEDVRSVAHFEHPKANLLGSSVAVGGVVLAVTAETVGTAKDLNSLSSGQLPSKHNYGLLAAGIAVAAGGIAIIAFGGRPKTIYEAKAASSGAPQK